MDAATSKSIVARKCFGQDENEYVWLINSRPSKLHPDNTFHNFKATLPRLLYHHETCDVMLNSCFSNWRIGANELEEDYYLPFTIWSFDMYCSDTKNCKIRDYCPTDDGDLPVDINVTSFTDLDNTFNKFTGKILIPRGTVFQNQFDSLNLIAQSLRGGITDKIILENLFKNVITCDLYKETDIKPRRWWQEGSADGTLGANGWPSILFSKDFCDGLRNEIGRVLWQPSGKFGILGMFTYGHMVSSCWTAGNDQYDGNVVDYNRSENCICKARCFIVGLHFVNDEFTGPTRQMLGNYEKITVNKHQIKLARLLGFPQTQVIPYSIIGGCKNAFTMMYPSIGNRCRNKYFYFSEPRWDAFVSHIVRWRKLKQDTLNMDLLSERVHAIGICDAKQYYWPANNYTNGGHMNNDTTPYEAYSYLSPTTLLNKMFEIENNYDYNDYENGPIIEPKISICQYPYGDYSSTLARQYYVNKVADSCEVYDPILTNHDLSKSYSVFLVPTLTPDFYMDDEVLLLRIKSPITTLTYMDENYVDFIAVVPVYNVSADSSFTVYNVYLEPYTIDLCKAAPAHPKYYYNLFTSNKDCVWTGSGDPVPGNNYGNQEPNPKCTDPGGTDTRYMEWTLTKTGPYVWYPLPSDIFTVYSNETVDDEHKYEGYVYRPFNVTYPGGNIYVNQIGNYQPFKWLNEFQERAPVKLFPDGAELNELEIEIVNRFGVKPAVTVFGCKIPETNINLTMMYSDTTYKRRCFSSFYGTRIPFTN